ncbi:hypothetical protein Tco_1519972 [Tanacetum coccineum]
MQAPLRARFRDLPTVNIKEILQQRMFEDDLYKDNNVHKDLYEDLQKSLELNYSNQHLADQEEARKKRRKRHDAPRSPHGYESTGIARVQELSLSDDLMHDDSSLDEQASALATTYEPPAENSLLLKIGDMTTFLNLYCQRMNKIMLTQADFKGQAYEVVKAFYPDVIHLQFQIEECHKMLTDQVTSLFKQNSSSIKTWSIYDMAAREAVLHS